jgi:hypothetical protein
MGYIAGMRQRRSLVGHTALFRSVQVTGAHKIDSVPCPGYTVDMPLLAVRVRTLLCTLMVFCPNTDIMELL